MSEDEKEATTFNEDQQNMFGAAEANQAGTPVRPREPASDLIPDVHFEPVEKRTESAEADEPQRQVIAARSAGGTDITGGTDKYGPGGLADSGSAESGSTGASESGDIAGASSTHAGAGGDVGQTGGTGIAPNTVGSTTGQE